MNPSNDTELLYLEDMKVGDRWFSRWREITANDVSEFAALTGDHDPLHSQEAGESPFGKPVAHGLLGLSVLAGLSSVQPNAATLALIGISDWQFEAPIYFGDRVQVLTEIEEMQPHGRRAGRVTWVRRLLNQDGRVVQHGRFVSLVASRNRVKRPAHAKTAKGIAAKPRQQPSSVPANVDV
ncbi:MAG: acyl dehydratase [Pirellulales bacterium]|nr:acyl dehydratase [Pirellulales bacterium]